MIFGLLIIGILYYQFIYNKKLKKKVEIKVQTKMVHRSRKRKHKKYKKL